MARSQRSWRIASETEPRHLLVIDDEFGIAQLLRRQLEARGFGVDTADCASTALTYLETHQPDLVILDLRLPDISGYELCWTLRRIFNHAQLPIVILTGVEQCLEDLEREAAGADAFLRKPCHPDDLAHTVNQLLHLSEL